jgi:UDP-GlcNAc:undecaprenyl-phosphate/decaprenyl-phosphate GlcNAc-1-phosphate transferase
MDRSLIATILFLICTPSAALLTWRSIPLAVRLGIVDQPTPRGVSRRVVPRIGGIPIMLTFVLGVALSFSLDVDRFPSEIERVALLCCAGALIAVVMVADDFAGLAVRSKLGLQLIAAGIVVLPRLRGGNHGISIDTVNLPVTGRIDLPLLIALPFTIVWFVGLMNTLNWADGIDGLASSIALVAAFIMFLHTFFWPRDDPQFTISILPLVLAAALVGFLPFNWSPARIMLGDSGSNFLGLILAGIAIIGGAKLATALLVLGLPVLDGAVVIAMRRLRGRPISQADASHLHHRLIQRGWSQEKIVVAAAAVSLTFGLLALALPNREAKLMAIGVLGILVSLTVVRARSAAL